MRVLLQQPDVLRELGFLKPALREDTDLLTLQTEGEALVMTAASSLCYMRTRVPAGVVLAGGGRILGMPLQRLLSGVGAAQFALDMRPSEKQASLESGPFTAYLNKPYMTTHTDPRVSLEYKHSFDIPSATLSSLIKLASSAFPEATQSMGVLFEANPDRTRIVSTDGHRLNVATAPGIDADARVIFSSALLLQIAKALDGYNGNVIINYTTGAVIEVLAGDRLLRGGLLDKPFPDFERIVPKEFSAQLTIDRGDFGRALHRTAILAGVESPSVVLTFDGEELALETKSSTTDKRGKTTEEKGRDVVTAIEKSGLPFRVRVSSDYLREALETVGTARVQLMCVSEKLPVLIAPVSEHQNIRVIIMPMSMEKW